jgi:hypothetical protein
MHDGGDAMTFKLQISRQTLISRWRWTSLAAVLAFLVLFACDRALKVATGFGTADLQGVFDAAYVRGILDHWQNPADAAFAGFLLGFDFLFIPLYGAALYFGAVAARDRFAVKSGTVRRLFDALTLLPPIAALCDIAENVIELAMLRFGPNALLADVACRATSVKYVGLLAGLVLSLAAAVASFAKKHKAEGD